MKTVALLLLGLTILVTIPIICLQKSNQTVEFAGEQSCIELTEVKYSSTLQFSVAQNLCENQNISFTIDYQTNEGEESKTTDCLQYRQSEVITNISNGFKIINQTTKAC